MYFIQLPSGEFINLDTVTHIWQEKDILYVDMGESLYTAEGEDAEFIKQYMNSNYPPIEGL